MVKKKDDIIVVLTNLILKHAPNHSDFKVNDIIKDEYLDEGEKVYFKDKYKRIRDKMIENGLLHKHNMGVTSLTDKGRQIKHGKEPFKRMFRLQWATTIIAFVGVVVAVFSIFYSPSQENESSNHENQSPAEVEIDSVTLQNDTLHSNQLFRSADSLHSLDVGTHKTDLPNSPSTSDTITFKTLPKAKDKEGLRK